MLIKGLSPLMKGAKMNRVVHFNNWLLSTNLYEPLLRAIVNKLQETYSQNPIIFRSLNQRIYNPLMKNFT
ncbi:hypothetical protein IC619_016340 [Hazenella sp. IB182353]|uniref:hypothetical protein n=1 Tax=Polycladospora coralii TaxID=2771432 RepID=UPI001746D991|nr:hypothetical protein [Polycladospora coralii]MBS7532016.1 hypothetical protein [Polycladospora coralii]